MIQKALKILEMDKDDSVKEDLLYWLNKSPGERIEAIEILRRQCHGSSARLQRSARIIQQK